MFPGLEMSASFFSGHSSVARKSIWKSPLTHSGFPAENRRPSGSSWGKTKVCAHQHWPCSLAKGTDLFQGGKQGLEGVYWRPNSHSCRALPRVQEWLQGWLAVSMCLQTRVFFLKNYLTISRKERGISGYRLPLPTSSSQLLQPNLTLTWAAKLEAYALLFKMHTLSLVRKAKTLLVVVNSIPCAYNRHNNIRDEACARSHTGMKLKIC